MISMNSLNINLLKLQDTIEIEGKSYLLSTVHLPIPLCIGSPPYETMLFSCNKNGVNWGSELYLERYFEREAAINNHNKLLSKLEKGVKFWE